MKSVRTLAVAIALLTLVAVGVGAQDWKLDRTHSNIGFTVRHMLVSKVSGEFTDFDAQLNFDPNSLATSSVEFIIQTASINTNSEKRDAHLRSGDFFLVDSFPAITFKSTNIVLGEGDNFQILGDLTVRGVTKQVTFDATRNGVIETARGDRAGFSATTRIKRLDYGVKWDAALETGGLVVSDEVDIHVDLVLVKPKPQPQG